MLEASFVGASLTCAALTVFFVGSLYVWNLFEGPRDRDHPSVIKKRSLSVLTSCILAALVLHLFWEENENPECGDFLAHMGLRLTGLLPAIFLPLLLTMILFLGPLVHLYLDPELRDPLFDASDLRWWRNIVIGPLGEEWVFRSCFCPLLLAAGYGWTGAMVCSPLYFGLAHLHHVLQHLGSSKEQIMQAALVSLFQLFYTTIFGTYSAFIFLRTGHLVAPFIVHAFCNYMGFPRIDCALEHPSKIVIGLSYVVGLLSFMALLIPLTDPSIYEPIFNICGK